MCFKRNETSFSLQFQVKRCSFLMTAAADHSWISCQPTLTAVETSDEFVSAQSPTKCYDLYILSVTTQESLRDLNNHIN